MSNRDNSYDCDRKCARHMKTTHQYMLDIACVHSDMDVFTYMREQLSDAHFA